MSNTLPVVTVLLGAVVAGSAPGVVASQASLRPRTVRVSVIPADGAVVPALTPADFEVEENGDTRPVIDVGRAGGRIAATVLVNDKGSDINEIRSGVAAFMQRLQGQADVSLVSVAPTVLKVLDFTASPAEMIAGVQRLVFRPGANTGMLLSAIGDAADELGRREAARPALVVIHFEGPQFRSQRSAVEVLDRIERSGAVFAVVAVGAPELRRMPQRLTEDVQGDDWTVDDQNLDAVLGGGPGAFGGRRRNVTSAQGLTSAMRGVADDLLNQYVVIYGSDGRGEGRKLAVRLKRKGLTLLAPSRIR